MSAPVVDNGDLLVFRRRHGGRQGVAGANACPACVMSGDAQPRSANDGKPPAYPSLRCAEIDGAMGCFMDDARNNTDDVIVRVAVLDASHKGRTTFADAFFRFETKDATVRHAQATTWLNQNKLELHGDGSGGSLANLVKWLNRHKECVSDPPTTAAAWFALELGDRGIVWDVIVNMYASDVKFHDRAFIFGAALTPESRSTAELVRPQERRSPFYDSVCGLFMTENHATHLDIFEDRQDVSARVLRDWRHVLLDVRLDPETTPTTFVKWQMDLRLSNAMGDDFRWALALETPPSAWHEGIVASFMLLHAVYNKFCISYGKGHPQRFDKLVSSAVDAYDDSVADGSVVIDEPDDQFALIMGSYGDGAASFVLQSAGEQRGHRVWSAVHEETETNYSGRDLAEMLDKNDPPYGTYVTRKTPPEVEALFQAPWLDKFSWGDSHEEGFWPFQSKSIEGFLCVVKTPSSLASSQWRSDIQHVATVHTPARPYPWVVCELLKISEFNKADRVKVRRMTVSELRHTKQSATFLDMPAEVTLRSDGTNVFVDFDKTTYVQQNDQYLRKEAGDTMVLVGLQPGEQEVLLEKNMERPILDTDIDGRVIIKSWVEDWYTQEEQGYFTSLDAVGQVDHDDPTFEIMNVSGMIVKAVITATGHTECRNTTLEAVRGLVGDQETDVTVLLLPGHRGASVEIADAQAFPALYESSSTLMKRLGRMELRDDDSEHNNVSWASWFGIPWTDTSAKATHTFEYDSDKLSRGTNDSVALEVYDTERQSEWLSVYTCVNAGFRSVHAINNVLVSNLSLHHVKNMDFSDCVFTVSKTALTPEDEASGRLFTTEPSLHRIQNLKQEVVVHQDRGVNSQSAEVCIESVPVVGCYEAFQYQVHKKQALLVNAMLNVLSDGVKQFVDVSKSSARACSIDSSGKTCSIYIDLAKLGTSWGWRAGTREFEDYMSQTFGDKARWTDIKTRFAGNAGVAGIVGDASLDTRMTGTLRTSVRDEVRTGIELWHVPGKRVMVRSVMVPTDAAVATTPSLNQVVRGAELATIATESDVQGFQSRSTARQASQMSGVDIYDAVYKSSMDVILTFESTPGGNDIPEALVPERFPSRTQRTAAPFGSSSTPSAAGIAGRFVSREFDPSLLSSRVVSIANPHSEELARLQDSIRVVPDGLIVESPVQVEDVFFDVGTRVISIDGEQVKTMKEDVKRNALASTNIRTWSITVPTRTDSPRGQAHTRVVTLTREARHAVTLLIAEMVGTRSEDDNTRVVYVKHVAAGSDAYTHGVRDGDRVLMIGDTSVADHKSDGDVESAWSNGDEGQVKVQLDGCTDKQVLHVLVEQEAHDAKFNIHPDVLAIRELRVGIHDTAAYYTTDYARFRNVYQTFAGDPKQSTNIWKLRDEISNRVNVVGEIEESSKKTELIGQSLAHFTLELSLLLHVNLEDHEKLGVTSVMLFDWKHESNEVFVQTVDRRGVAWKQGVRCGDRVAHITVKDKKMDFADGRRTNKSLLLSAIQEPVATWAIEQDDESRESFHTAMLQRNKTAKFHKDENVIKLAMLLNTRKNRFDSEDAALGEEEEALRQVIIIQHGKEMVGQFFGTLLLEQKTTWFDELLSTLFLKQRVAREREEYERVSVHGDRAKLRTILDSCNYWFSEPTEELSNSQKIVGLTFKVPMVLSGTRVEVGRSISMINGMYVSEYTRQTVQSAFERDTGLLELELDPRFAQAGAVVHVRRPSAWGCTYQFFFHNDVVRGEQTGGNEIRAVYVESVESESDASLQQVEAGIEVLEVDDCHVSLYTDTDLQKALCRPAKLLLSPAKTSQKHADLVECSVAETMFEAYPLVQEIRKSLESPSMDGTQRLLGDLVKRHHKITPAIRTWFDMPFRALRKDVELRAASFGRGKSQATSVNNLFRWEFLSRVVVNDHFLAVCMEPFYNHDGKLKAVYVIYSGEHSRGRHLGLTAGVRVRTIKDTSSDSSTVLTLDSTCDPHAGNGFEPNDLVKLLNSRHYEMVVEKAPDMDGLRDAWVVNDLNERWWSTDNFRDVVQQILDADRLDDPRSQAQKLTGIMQQIQSIFVVEDHAEHAYTLVNLLMGLVPLDWRLEEKKLMFTQNGKDVSVGGALAVKEAAPFLSERQRTWLGQMLAAKKQ